MPLAEPPVGAGSLAGCQPEPLAGRSFYRMWRPVAPDGGMRPNPWWFGSVPTDPAEGGRFDLPAPMGTCYLATRSVGSVLESLQAHLVALPAIELQVRRLARITAPSDAPPAARLTSRQLAGRHGVTAALWAGGDRALTQRWAAAFRRDGWWALYGGLQHDPSARLRGVSLFDHAGAHTPTMGGAWTYRESSPLHDHRLIAALARFGVQVREPGDLPFVTPPA